MNRLREQISERVSTWASGLFRTHGVVASLCLMVIGSLVFGLLDGEWLEAPDVLWIAGLAAIPAGLLLGRIARKPGVAIGLAAAAGLFFSVAYHSRALPPLSVALGELAAQGQWIGGEAARLARGAFDPEVTVPPAPRPTMPEWQAAGERLALYAWNVASEWPPQVSGQQLRMGQIQMGSLLGFLVWAISAVNIWVVARRRSVWGAFAPLAALLAISIYFSGKGWPYLVISTTACLLLTCDLSQKRLLSRWREDSLPYDFGIDRWVSAGTIAGAVALGMMFTVQVTDPKTREWFDETFFPKQPAPVAAASPGGGSSGSRGNPVPLGTLPTQHLLGSGPELSEQTVMHVHTPGVSQARFYWRAGAYDKYTGHGWIMSSLDAESEGAEPLWPESPEPPEHFAVLRQTYRLEGRTTQVYSAGRPVRLSQPARGLWLRPLGEDLLAVNTVTMQSGYEVLSWAPTATADELQGASTEYPDWVKESYLALPEELPERIGALAMELTADTETPYDKAVAIRAYLREYPYTLDLDAPPADRDVADYFLFNLKRGYCDYFATAMVVLTRSAGVPARLAVGYATGEYDPDNATYRVSIADAHAWPEVYFPEYGWIAFEPTAGFAEPSRGVAIDWAAQAEAAQGENIEAFPEETQVRAITGEQWAGIAAVVVAVVVTTGAIGMGVYRQRKRRAGTPREIIGGLYQELVSAGRRIGVAVSAAQTPDEFLAALRNEISARADRAPDWGGDWEARRARIDDTASALVRLYAQMTYSPHPPERWEIIGALDEWPGLSRGLWALWLVGLMPANQPHQPRAVTD